MGTHSLDLPTTLWDEVVLSTYSHDSHFDMLNAWLDDHEHRPILKEDMPENGWVVYFAGVPVAAMFLRKIEPNCALMDGLVTNKIVSSPIRHHCIEMLIEQAETRAITLGIRRLIAYSVNKSTLLRASAHGFQTTSYAVVVKEI